MHVRRLLSFILLGAVERVGGSGASHSFGQRHAIIRVGGARHQRLFEESSPLRILHITDAHVSLSDDDPPRTSRMHHAFEHTVDKATGVPTSSAAEFVRLMEMACAKSVDLIAFGGDIVNFPSNETVHWVLDRVRDAGCGRPFIYTAGNHDWHTEGLPGDGRYDAQRLPHLDTTLRPLLESSLLPDSRLYGRTLLKGVEILVLDNSNYQITQEQLDFARRHLVGRGPPTLLMLHMPLALPGVDLPPQLVCGHPEWGAAVDRDWETESRPRWPEEGNLLSTQEFLELVRAQAAPAGRIVALLTGHVHRDFSTPAGGSRGRSAANHTTLACDALLPGCAIRSGATVFEAGSAAGAVELPLEAKGAVQYTTLDAAEGGFRLLTMQPSADRGYTLL